MSETNDVENNRRIQQEVAKALRTGTGYPGAKFFVWGESLFFGTVREKSRGSLSGNFVRICDCDSIDLSEESSRRVLRRIAKVMNAATPAV